MKYWPVFVTAVFAASIPFPLTAHELHWNAGSDITVGAVLGGVIGYQIDKDDGAVVGAILGAIAGSQYGHSERHHQSRHFSYHEEQRLRQAVRDRIKRETRQLSLQSDELFEPGHARLTPLAANSLDPVVATLKQYPRTQMHVTGYAGSEGQEYQNRVRALAQAEAVALYLVIKGIARNRIESTGYSAPQPAAQRIELLIEPVFSDADLGQ